MKTLQTIYLCDDEPGVRESLAYLLGQHAMQVSAHASGPDLLAHLADAPQPVRGVFVLDVKMEPMPSGIWVHEQLIARGLGQRNPVIFLSGHGDIPAAVAAMAKGALNFIEKPYDSDALIALLRQALALEEEWQTRGRRCDFLRSMRNSLSRRQMEVGLMVEAGIGNKVIGTRLGIVERMVEVHRSRLFERLGVDGAAALATTFANMRACGIDMTPPPGPAAAG